MREILTEGQRLFKIREKLDITQEAIAGKHERTYVSKFENDKKKLSEHKDIAEHFVKNINGYIDRCKLNVPHVTVEYLIETVDEQANRYVQEITELISSKAAGFEELKNEGLELISKFGVLRAKQNDENEIKKKHKNKKAKHEKECGIIEENVDKFCTAVADYYSDIHDYDSEELFIFKRFELCFDNHKTLTIFDICTKLMRNSYYQTRYMHVISMGKVLLKLIEKENITDPQRISKVYLNTALAHKARKEYEKCVATVDEWESKTIVPDNFKYWLKTLKSNCYVLVGRYNEAMEIYLNELNKSIDNGNKGDMANNYANVAYAYLKLENIPKAIEYVEKALKLIYEVIDVYKMNIYYNALEVYSGAGDIEKSLSYFELSVAAAEKVKSSDKMHKIFDTMIDFCIKVKMDDKLVSLLDMAESKIIVKSKCELAPYFVKIVSYFRHVDLEKFFYVFDKGKDILDKTKL